MIRVKICGITRLEDAAEALLAGADYLGFIFYPASPRAIDVEMAAAVVAGLRARADTSARFASPDPPRLVGVFVNETAGMMARVLDRCGLDLAQLSGEEVPELVNDPASPLFGRSYKAIRPKNPADAVEQTARYLGRQTAQRPRLLLDSYHPSLRGGSGEVGDWAAAAALVEEHDGLMLAGGLTPENVEQAIRAVRPYAVDVASGVEATPGRKDPAKVRAFIEAVRQAG